MFSAKRGLNLHGREKVKIKLRTLVLLRWLAIGGQIAAIATAYFYFGYRLPLSFCVLAVGASVVVNLTANLVFPETKRLDDTEAMALLSFDVIQLSALLFLTGGLTNPFALLILAPVVISASALPIRITILIGALAICLVSVIAFVKIPLQAADGTMLTIPALFEFGFWLSIVTGIVFLGLYAQRVASEIQSMSDALLATQMALSREQKLTDLSGVVAAAAHELGTPLATIKLASAELVSDLVHQPALREDAQLIHDQANRCRDILRSMGRAGKDDLQMRSTPLETLLRDAAEPHLSRGKTIHFSLFPGDDDLSQQPVVLRKAEVIHGLRNLIQNAVDFSHETVWLDGEWTKDRLTVRIVDDGEGFPPQMLGRIGDPFLRWQRSENRAIRSPDYDGMGLGLFIAKTLLERTGAELFFANGAPDGHIPIKSGAIVEVVWPREKIEAAEDRGLGLNQPNEEGVTVSPRDYDS